MQKNTRNSPAAGSVPLSCGLKPCRMTQQPRQG
jgi:hypothetical protein